MSSYILDVTIAHIRPKIWRKLRVPAHFTLGQLHDVLQVAFQWQDHHLHEFEVGQQRYGARHADDERELSDEDDFSVMELDPLYCDVKRGGVPVMLGQPLSVQDAPESTESIRTDPDRAGGLPASSVAAGSCRPCLCPVTPWAHTASRCAASWPSASARVPLLSASPSSPQHSPWYTRQESNL